MTTATPRYSRLHVVLHGYGAEPGDIAAIAPVVDPDDRFVTIAPRGPIAADATGEQRTRLWEAQKRDAPQFAEYEANTDRTIPVVVLSRH